MPERPSPHRLQAAELAGEERARAARVRARASGFVPGKPQPPRRLTAYVETLTGAAPLTFSVDGLPVPQGSMRAFVIKGRAMVTHGAGKELAVWRQAIAARAREAGATPQPGPVAITLTFRLLRPPSRPKRETQPDRRPDLDKLVRATLDALTGIAFLDDAQVVRCLAEKRYDVSFPGLTVTLTPA